MRYRPVEQWTRNDPLYLPVRRSTAQRPEDSRVSVDDIRFFFTAEDPRELPKGSRDPLRFIPVWGAAGRELIPYLTTVTPSYRGFLTRFLFHGALELYELPLTSASADDQWPAFCRFEQLCAVVRTVLKQKTPWLPGSTSVPRRVKNGVLTVSSHSGDWLGKSQKTTGFWGYYHQASRGSGILETNQADRPGYVLTPDARSAFNQSSAKDLLHELRPSLESVLLQKSASVQIDAFHRLAEYFHAKPANELALRRFWVEHILIPDREGPGGELRAAFAERAREAATQRDSNDTGALWESLCAGDPADGVTALARNIRATEAIIGLSEWAFDVCRMMQERMPSLQAARHWANAHGYGPEWLSRIRELQEPEDVDLQELRYIALDNDDSFIPLASALLDRHKAVMRRRSGAAWVTRDADDQLTIRQPAETPRDLTKHSGAVIWRYDYFLGSWLTAAREIGYLPEGAAND